MSDESPYAHERVRAFLADAGIRPEFAARALARIEAQDEQLGDSYKWSSLSMLVAECAQEAEDIGAWAACAAVRLEHGPGDAFADRRARALLLAAVERAGEADTLLCELRRLIERAAWGLLSIDGDERRPTYTLTPEGEAASVPPSPTSPNGTGPVESHTLPSLEGGNGTQATAEGAPQ